MSTDVDTIACAISGDEAAQRALYEAHHAAAFRLAFLLLQDACDAEEVVQDAFVYAFRNLRRYDAGRASFKGWLRVILVCRCRNRRRRRMLPSVSLEVLEAIGQSPADPAPSGNPAALVELRGRQQAVWEALQEVSAGARDALILRYYEGMAYAEIGEALGCSAAAARARVAHGKSQMRDLLAVPSRQAVVGEPGVARPAEVG